jgi:hypothetical protein
VNDTTPEAARVYRGLLLSKPGAERLRMGCEMFETAKEFVLAGLREKGEERLRERLFLRLYGQDFGPDERDRIVAAVRAWEKP